MGTEKTPKIVGYWLLSGAFLILLMVFLGGYTRLTHSGLSMVDWKPISGTLPPMNETEWLAEFENYKTSPEFQKLNYSFSVDEFKTIFWPEFIHRVTGRLLGIVFIFPFLYFYFRKMIREKGLLRNLIIIFLLGGLQGGIGWFMVASGLKDIPYVSHYRLAIHFSAALTLYCYIIWVAMKVFYPANNSAPKKLGPILKPIYSLLVVTCIQIIYGAFVAGLKAGLYFNNFPKMGDEWMPNSITNRISEMGLISLFDFPITVQFIHRWLAVIIVGIVVWILLKSKNFTLNKVQKTSLILIAGAVGIQFLLGVFTLLNAVPVSLGVAHQFGAVVLLTCIIYSIYFFGKDTVNKENLA